MLLDQPTTHSILGFFALRLPPPPPLPPRRPAAATAKAWLPCRPPRCDGCVACAGAACQPAYRPGRRAWHAAARGTAAERAGGAASRPMTWSSNSDTQLRCGRRAGATSRLATVEEIEELEEAIRAAVGTFDQTMLVCRLTKTASGASPLAPQPAQHKLGRLGRLQAPPAGWRAAENSPWSLTRRGNSEGSSNSSGGSSAWAPPPPPARRRLQPCAASQRRQRDPASYSSMDELRAELEREGSDGPVTGLIKWLGAAANSASSAASPLQVWRGAASEAPREPRQACCERAAARPAQPHHYPYPATSPVSRCHQAQAAYRWLLRTGSRGGGESSSDLADDGADVSAGLAAAVCLCFPAPCLL